MIIKEKLVHQLFIGKVSEIIGFEKVVELLKESNKIIEKHRIMKKELNKIHLLTEEVADTIKDLTRHPETGEDCGQDYSDSKNMVEIFIQSGFGAYLLEMFWQRKSDGCPLDVTERDDQLNNFEEWLKCISFENVDTYLNIKKKSL